MMSLATLPQLSHMPVRKPAINFEGDSPRWMANNLLISYFMNTLSAAFPAGEGLFIKVIRTHLEYIEDPVLLGEAKQFLGQEAEHSKVHCQMNRWLKALDVPIVDLSESATTPLSKLSKQLTNEQLLATTAAFEHYTAIIGRWFLDNAESLCDVKQGGSQVLIWHAFEEIEHKAVCYDVYQHVVGNKWLRRKEMCVTTLKFATMVLGAMLTQLRRSRLRPTLKELRQLLPLIFGGKGLITRSTLAFIDYIRADFHPAQHDDSALLDTWRPTVDSVVVKNLA